MAQLEQAIQERFGRWTVMATQRINRRVYCDCSCVCGNTGMIRRDSLLVGDSKSCGCLASDTARAQETTHGETANGSSTPEFRIWSGMQDRCLSPTNRAFHRYGGRGISVSKRWLGARGFRNFLEDVGRRPSKLHSLDRVDNDGNYEPGNVRWATAREQHRNKSTNRVVFMFGRKQCLKAWCEELQVNYHTVKARLRLGWTERQALLTCNQRRAS